MFLVFNLLPPEGGLVFWFNKIQLINFTLHFKYYFVKPLEVSQITQRIGILSILYH